MKFWPKILEVGKWIGAVATIGGAVLFFDNVRDNINDNFSDVMDTLSGFRKTLTEHQFESNKILEIKSSQIEEIVKELRSLQINQKAIILKSDESKQILEEIKNQQLINGSVDINYLESRDAYVVQVKKKDTLLE
jgi:hypothetical protein